MALFVRATMTAFPDHRAAMAADHRLRLDRLDGARLLRGDRPDQHQAADGLFVDRPYGLRAGRACRRHRRRRAGRAGLYRDLRRDDARHLRLHAVDARPRRHGGEYLRSRRPRAHQADDGVLLRDAAVLARRHSAARGLLREISTCSLAAIKAGLLRARGDRRADQRGRRLLLSADRQDHVFRRAAEELRADAERAGRGAGGRRPVQSAVHRLSGAASGCGAGRAPSRCSDADDICARAARGSKRDTASSSIETSGFDQRRGAARWRAPASAGRSGSSRANRRRGADGAAANGFQRHGNLAASLLLTGAVAPAVAATLGFAASLAVCEACDALAPGIAFALKWPNDVLADGKQARGHSAGIRNAGRAVSPSLSASASISPARRTD